MTTTQETLFSRLRTFSRDLYSLDRKLFGEALFSFPWEELSKQLEKTFKLPVKLTPGEIGWQENVKMPKSAIPIAVSLPGIQGQIFITFPRKDLELFMATLLKVSLPTLKQQDESFFEQFCHFFAVTLLSCSHGVPELAPLSPKLDTPQESTGVGALVQNIKIQFQEEEITAQAILPPDFLEGWKQKQPTKKEIRSDLMEQFAIKVNLEAGRTFVQPEDLTSLQVGDFLLVDHPFYIPESTRARVYLTHKGTPLFRAKIKNGALKILEMPLQHEAFTPIGGLSMTTQEPQENIEQPEEEEIEPSEEIPEEPTEEEAAAPEEAKEEVPEEPAEEEAAEEKEEEQPTELPEEEVKSAQKTHLSREPLRVEEIPLTVVVQFAELNMTLQQLSSLHPGNLLDLNIRPEDGVVLVVNDRVCAEGELVMIGDKVGVRIKEVGFEAKADAP